MISITTNRVMRCSKAIAEGDEITRIAAKDSRLDCLVKADMVVVSTETMKVGTLSAQLAEGGVIINYADEWIDGSLYQRI